MQSGLVRNPEMRALRTAVGAARAGAQRTLHARPAAPSPAPVPHATRLQTALGASMLDALPSKNTVEATYSTTTPAGPAEQQPLQEQAVKPGDDDATRFQLHWSVNMWRPFEATKWLQNIDNEAAPVPDRIRAFTETLTNAVSTAGVLGSSDAARYWAYHLTRSGFFSVQGLAGLLATRNASGRDENSPAVNRFEWLFRRGWAGPLTEAMLTYYQDFENIKEGKYGLPWDMVDFSHRQFNPLFILQRGAAFLSEATATLRRRDQGVPDQVWLKSGFLPDYYQSTFHYQSDGWLSASSAKVYETSTETLFVGRQDSMQRSTLVPLADFMRGKDASQIQALEIAAGTGRFATFVKDNYPSLNLTVSDLSPFYLAEARNNIKYWKKQRAPDAQLGGPDGTGVTFLQTAAEKLDVPDASQDVVYCVYLFHELPADVRKKAVAEMARVVKPGGIVILTDSAQSGDRDVYEASLGNFGDFNEPYYRDYITTPLGPLFEEAGLKCDMKLLASTTKTLSFRKPMEDDLFAVAGSQEAAAQAAAAAVIVEALAEE